MLHLLTSQVTFRNNTCASENNISEPVTVIEQHFKHEHDNSEWKKYSECTFTAMLDRNEQSDKPLLYKIEQNMQHWNPDSPDNVVYATVDEAHSGSIDDVGSYLVKLKKDLHIGEDGYPKFVILGGDQQTYAHMKNLKLKHKDHYNWFYPVPGDWHIMKTAAEVIKQILADGGFKVFAAKCGHKGDITQWQDIHNVLTACHEALLSSAVCDFQNIHTTHRHDKFWEWLDNLTCDSNNNEVCQFWAQMLKYLHAYTGFYFAIRSGNWLLRTSCLKILTELFFAYSRDKYEVLSVNALSDSYTYPKEILDLFKNGQWTVSVKARPFHNLALDEAHECIVNRKLKQITTRPSHFRMVELADFMAYLDSVVSGLETCAFQFNKSSDYQKKKNNTRAKLLSNLISDKNIFKYPQSAQALCNIFIDNSPELPQVNKQDLLQICKIGRERMFSYIRQYTLYPPTELRQKRRRQRLKTFTKAQDTSRKLNTKLNQATLLLSSAYRSLLNPCAGYKQTFPLPLALCNAYGEMRSCTKSEFRDVVLNLFPSSNTFVTQCPLINGNSCNDHELIIDFLFILHQPPPPDVITFSNYAAYLWNKLIYKLGTCRGAKVIRIVVDKPKYLPKPRELLHRTRSSKTGIMNRQDCDIRDDGLLPHCKAYQMMLANPELKKQYVHYLMAKFTELGCCNKLPVHVILDYQDMCPFIIYNGVKIDLPMLDNKNGEADYNVWFHCMTCTLQNVIILGSDTDIWVYGMVYKDCGWLGRKNVYVE